MPTPQCYEKLLKELFFYSQDFNPDEVRITLKQNNQKGEYGGSRNSSSLIELNKNPAITFG